MRQFRPTVLQRFRPDPDRGVKTDERYRIEQAKWDSLAERALANDDALYVSGTFHEAARRDPLLVGVAEFLGDLSGLRVLEYGCGLGKISVRLARSGAEVSAFDLSPKSVEVARRPAEVNGVAERIDFRVAAGEDLPYADESFEAVFGKAVLHHLDVDVARPELYRVMKAGSRAAFSEPMGMNPIVNVVRDHLPYPKKTPRGADRPLTYADIDAWGRPFSSFEFREVQLISMLERGLGFGKSLPRLRALDDRVLARWPAARRYCRYVVMKMAK